MDEVVQVITPEKSGICRARSRKLAIPFLNWDNLQYRNSGKISAKYGTIWWKVNFLKRFCFSGYSKANILLQQGVWYL